MASAPTFEIARMLTVSTTHIPASERDAATREAFWDNQYGWVFYVGDPQVEDAPCLAALVQIARRLDCLWLRLDRDGPVLPEFPAFDW